MEFELTPAKFNMLSKLLDYELRNTDFELKHLENIQYKDKQYIYIN